MSRMSMLDRDEGHGRSTTPALTRNVQAFEVLASVFQLSRLQWTDDLAPSTQTAAHASVFNNYCVF